MSFSPSQRPLAHGRPRIPSKQDLMDYAFGVPDSPPQHVARKTLQRRLSKMWTDDTDDEKSSVSSKSSPAPRKQKEHTQAAPPFEGVMQGEARHKVCDSSLQPWSYLLTLRGKNVRDMLLSAFNAWIHCDAEQLVIIKQVIAYLHSASLIVDDIEDESATRRGEPAAHIKYGVAPSLNAANYVYFLALEKLLTLQNTDAVFAYTSEMCNLHRGQGRDIFWRVSSEIVSEERYLHMVQDKTGGLFRLAIRVMCAVAPQADPDNNVEDKDSSAAKIPGTGGRSLERMTELCNDMASFFQIRDDLINISSPSFQKSKGYCEDITEGKLSFIALHSLRGLQGTKQFDELLNLLQMKTTDRSVMKRALIIMDETRSFDYTLHFLNQLKMRIDFAIKALGGNKGLTDVINALAKDLEDCNVQAVIDMDNSK